jgi:hypothetical protein
MKICPSGLDVLHGDGHKNRRAKKTGVDLQHSIKNGKNTKENTHLCVCCIV